MSEQQHVAAIKFYSQKKKNSVLSNYWQLACPFELDGREWKTSEAAYQASKFGDWPDYQDEIQRVTTANQARLLGQKGNPKPPRSRWPDKKAEAVLANPAYANVRATAQTDDDRVRVMERVLAAKFAPGTEEARLLVETGAAELVEDSKSDAFWGAGRAGTGRNELGKALMRRRAQLASIAAPACDSVEMAEPEKKKKKKDKLVMKGGGMRMLLLHATGTHSVVYAKNLADYRAAIGGGYVELLTTLDDSRSCYVDEEGGPKCLLANAWSPLLRKLVFCVMHDVRGPALLFGGFDDDGNERPIDAHLEAIVEAYAQAADKRAFLANMK